MPNAYQPVSSGSSLEQAIAMFNNNFAKLDNEAVTKVFRGAGGINAFTLGQIKDVGVGLILRDQDDLPRIVCYIDSSGTPILKVSKDGYDAITTGNENLIFNSAQNVLKIVLSGTASLSYDGVVTTFLTIPHGLSTIPIVQVYVQLPNDAAFSPMQAHYVPMPIYQVRAGLPSVQCVQTVDATNIYIRVHDIYSTVPSPMVYNFRYYAFQETAS